MSTPQTFQVGDRFFIGSEVLVLDDTFYASLQSGDEVMAVATTKSLKRISLEIRQLVDDAVSGASDAFRALGGVSIESVSDFFKIAAELLADNAVFMNIAAANAKDLADAQERARSTTRLELSAKMRSDMVQAFEMWRDASIQPTSKIDELQHQGWSVEQWRAPLGVIGFVFEGRPNVFADATGVLKTGNTVVFRIGSDALRTAEAIMENVIRPALDKSGLPVGAVQLISSKEHAAGWKLFSDKRLSLAVARGSGEAVAELGSIAQQSGVPVSLHGTGGAWMIVGESANADQLLHNVQHSLDRKVCNTLNVICVPRSRASELIPQIFSGAELAADARGVKARVHAVNGAESFMNSSGNVLVHRAEGAFDEQQISSANESDLGHEFEWEINPEFFVVVVDSVDHAIQLFNKYSPQFVVSAITDDEDEQELVWRQCNAPFFGNGFTRWVDGQFALLRPELGLSNWQNGRLFARSGVLSGDSAFSVRLRVRQSDANLHR